MRATSTQSQWHIRWFVALAFNLIVVPSCIADAEPSTTAKEWLEKLTTYLNSSPVSCEFTAIENRDVLSSVLPSLRRGGDRPSPKTPIEGSFIQLPDGKHARVEVRSHYIRVARDSTGAPTSETPFTTSVLAVQDGKFLWLDIREEGEPPTVARMPFSMVAKHQGLDLRGPNLDRVLLYFTSQLPKLVASAEYTVTSATEAEITLVGQPTAQLLAAYVPEFPPHDRKEQVDLADSARKLGPIEFTIERATGRPLSLAIGSPPLLSMKFVTCRQLSKDGVDDATFQYCPPLGIQWIDVGASER